jgi:hypothetical protein
MKSAKEYSEFCEKTLFPKLEGLEARRKAIGNKRISFLLIVLILIVSHIIIILLDLLPLWSIMVSMLLVPSVFSFIYRQFGTDHRLTEDLENEVIKHSIPFLIGSPLYNEEQGIDYEVFARSRLFLQLPEDYKGRHLTKGRLDGSLVLFSTIECGYFRDMGKKELEWQNIFKGLMVVNAFERNLGLNAEIIPNSLEKNLYLIGKELKKYNFQRSQKVSFDQDKEFSQAYAIYADKPLEATYLITEPLRKVILNFKASTGIDVFISFVEIKVEKENKLENRAESKIYFAFSADSLVSTDISKTFLQPDSISGFYLCLAFVNMVLNELKLKFIKKPGVDWSI